MHVQLIALPGSYDEGANEYRVPIDTVLNRGYPALKGDGSFKSGRNIYTVVDRLRIVPVPARGAPAWC